MSQTQYLPEPQNQEQSPLPKPIFKVNKKLGQSKISAVLIITAVIIASALTFLIIQYTAV